MECSNAIADGRDAQFLATWEAGARRLRLSAAVCGIAIEGTTLRLEGAGAAAGRLFTHADAGLPIHIAPAGLTTTIARVLDAHQVDLAEAAPALSAAGRVVWPCFLPTDAGKTLWIEGGAGLTARHARRAAFIDGTPLPLQARIEAVHGPAEVTLALPLTAPGGTDIPQRVVWGTDNSAALLAAGEAAIAAGSAVLDFPRGLLCAFAAVQDFAQPPPYPGIGRVFGLLRWLGDDADAFVTDTAGNVLFLRPSPRTPRPFAPPPRGVAGRAHLPRLAAAASPVIVVAGDSMSTVEVWNGSPHSAASSPLGGLMEAIQLANPGKPCRFVDRSIGGATWQALDGFPNSRPGWYADREVPWLDYVRAVPDTAGATSPDLVILGIGGGNDGPAVSLSAMESVIAKVRRFPADAAGRPPDILLMTCRPAARWGRAGPVGEPGTPSGNFWAFQVWRETPNMLHRSFAALHGIGLLDYEDVAQRVLWGWSFSRTALRRVPDTDTQACSRTAPLSFRRRCRDFSFYLTLPGADGAAAWRGVGGVAVQIGSRPDNVAILEPDAEGRLTLQVNAWGSTTTALVGLDGTALETAGDRSTGDTLRWHMPHGSNAVVAHEGAWPFTEADTGSSILIPGAGHQGAPLRSTIVALGPNTLFVADCAASFAKASTNPLRWGGQFFVPSDADAGVDVLLPDTGQLARIAEHLGPTRVRLDRPLGRLQMAPQKIFVGRVAVPRHALPVQVVADPSPDPRLHVYVKGTQFFVGWLSAATRGLVQAYRGPCLRYGGPFVPRITPLTEMPVRLRATHCYIDDPIIEGQVLTDAEMWGMWDRHFAGPWDGNGVTHLTHRQFATVDAPLLRAQDFSTG